MPRINGRDAPNEFRKATNEETSGIDGTPPATRPGLLIRLRSIRYSHLRRLLGVLHSLPFLNSLGAFFSDSYLVPAFMGRVRRPMAMTCGNSAWPPEHRVRSRVGLALLLTPLLQELPAILVLPFRIRRNMGINRTQALDRILVGMPSQA